MAMQLHQMIKRNDVINGSKTATIDGARRKTWAEVAARVARLAGGFRGIGIGEGDRVAVLSPNSDRYFEYLFAAAWAGAVFVPVNIRLAPPEIAYWLSDSGSRALVIDGAFLPVLEHLKGKLPDLELLIYAGDGDTPEGMTNFEDLAQAGAIEGSARKGDDLAGLFYTGGTTGVSKGVMLSHGNLVFNSMVVRSHGLISGDGIYLHAPPMFHIADGACTFAVSLASGRHVFIPAFEPGAVLAAIQEHRISDSLLVPVMINMVVNHPEAASFDLRSLRTLIYGASPMPAAVLAAMMQLVPECSFYHAYGQTETAPLLTLLPPERHVTEGPLAGKMAAVGRPCVGMDVRILDEDGQEVPRGTVGEICVQGPNVMQGYWNKPDLTADAWRHGWHHTGDGGCMDEDGFIYVVDRMKDMIISGGENVYSAEVENAVYQHDDVIECAVIGVPDDRWGERVHAIVRLHEGAETDAEALIAHCRGLIAGFKCPRSVDLVDEPLPVSGAGKILKAELRKPFWEGQEKQVH